MQAFTVEVDNDPAVESSWAQSAAARADAYLEDLHRSLRLGLPASPLSRSASDDEVLYNAFRRVFPYLDLRVLQPNDPLRGFYEKECWRPLLRRHAHFVEDPCMLTILRIEACRWHEPENVMLVPYLQWLFIEVARNREGLNAPLVTLAGPPACCRPPSKEHLTMPTLRATKRFCVLEVVGRAPESGTDPTTSIPGDGVEDVLKALGCGGEEDEDASLRAVVQEEIERQLSRLKEAEAINRRGVAEQARGAVAPQTYRHVSPSAVLEAEQLLALKAGQPVIVDHVLSADVVARARAEAEAMRQAGLLHPTPQRREGTRYDVIRWLSDGQGDHLATEAPALHQAVLLLKGLAWAVEEAVGVGPLAVPEQCMLAAYEGTGGYVPHRDNVPRGRDGKASRSRVANDREVTAILYLNEADWDGDRDGGCLRCYVGAADDDEDGGSASQVVDVVPEGGRLVMFKSRALLHEVMRSSGRTRWALSIWILGRQGDDVSQAAQ